MKTVLLFEPELLAKVERESPGVYKYFCTMPFAKLEYGDYGSSNLPMLMPKFMLLALKSGLIKSDIESPQLMKAFQAGWVMGALDLVIKNNLNAREPMKKTAAFEGFILAAVNYHFYRSETLLDKKNFKVRDGITYSTITYKDGECMTAWNLILNSHENFNDFFVKANAAWDKHEAEQKRQ